MAVAGEAVHGEVLPGGCLDDALLGAGRELQDGVQAGRDAGDAHVGRPVGQGPGQGVAAAAVAEAGGADVAVVGAGGEELGEGELFEGADGASAAVGDDVGEEGGGSTIQPSRSPGARDLLAVPRWTT